MNLQEFRSRLFQNEEDLSKHEENRSQISIYQATGEDQHGRAFDIYGRPSAMGDAAAAQRWLKTIDHFANLATTYSSKMIHRLEDRVPYKSDGKKDSTDAIVALIDDGVDLLDPSIAPACIAGGLSFDFDGSRVKPFWGSEYGYGIAMARTITRISPKIQLHVIRPKIISFVDGGDARVDVKTTARATQAALDRKAVIVSISLTVLVFDSTFEERELLESVLAKACARGVVLFCCPADTGTTADYYPAGYKPDTFFRIGSSRTDGKIVSSAGPMGEIDFIPTGVDVASRNSSLPPVSGEANDKITLMSGSSVAAALGTGLAALLLHCFEILEFRGERFTDIASEACLSKLVYGRLKTHDGTMAASRNLGTVTEDKFINLWETLDPVIQVLEDSPRLDKEKFQCLNSFCLKLDSRDSRD